MVHSNAGQPVPTEQMLNVDRLQRAYYENRVDPGDPRQAVAFGTSGHRGTSLDGTFTDDHIAAITQAICDYRKERRVEAPLFLGRDTHALSLPAHQTALEVLVANQIEVRVALNDQPTATPLVSHAILGFNRWRSESDIPREADGIIITPSHNPPEDGGFKYNPPDGGPADTAITDTIQRRANELLAARNQGVKRLPIDASTSSRYVTPFDYITRFVGDLATVVDLEAIRSADVTLGVDPLGGASLPVWSAIADQWRLAIDIVNPHIDPRFAFMTLDHDGRVRMDCSSPYAMVPLVALRDRFTVAVGNDPDADRHGIVTRSAGLLNPNAYLACAIDYLIRHRPNWPTSVGIGKTLVSSSLIDRVVHRLGRKLVEVPVGFKWFSSGLLNGTLAFGGEESAGASFLRMDATVWTTDKDGIILGLLAAEMTAKTGEDPGVSYRKITADLGEPVYTRRDAPATPAQKSALKKLSAESVSASVLAGDPITARLTEAPGNGAALGGLKITTANGWFAARPSGTENIYKIYAESFRDENHLRQITDEAQIIVDKALGASG